MKSKRARQSPQLNADRGFRQIGEVADELGLTQRTLRYYESRGLLNPAGRLDGGFRLYSDADVYRLERILELKRLLGAPLSLIKEILEAEELLQQLREERRSTDDLVAKRASLERAMGIIEAQVGLVRERMSAMQQLQDRYERRLTRTRARLDRVDTHLAERPLPVAVARTQS
ncbi:MAG: hypothetical protein CL878_06300 [Dehalococcoidia bacterium]|nr:hypothetical protein [Dehalococcoidia bacterium]